MLQRVVDRLAEAVGPIVVVAAREQAVPPLPEGVRIIRDENDRRGPLEGLAAGLAALADEIDAAYITACDVPFLEPAFVRRVCQRLEENDIAVPHVDGFFHPLAGAYRASVLPHVRDLLAADRLRPFFLFERVATRRLDADDLSEVDPPLASLRNLNHPQDYVDALRSAGFEAPPEVLKSLLNE